jgi:hypothetical protein
MAERRRPRDDRVIGVALRRSLAVLVAIAAVVAAAAAVRWIGGRERVIDKRVEGPGALDAGVVDPPTIPFLDVGAAAGIDFVHDTGAAGDVLLPETMGAGVAIFDADGDRAQDLLLVNGDRWPWDRSPAERPTPRLYLNRGEWSFVDATERWGLDLNLYGMGVACGDVDGDGRTDVLLTAVGANRLLRNTPDGFVDITDVAGVAGDRDGWSTAAGFFDADADGDLDLLVADYVSWSRELDFEVGFTLNGRDRAYGPPTAFEGRPLTLWLNDGTGRFEPAGAEAGLDVVNPATGRPMAKALALGFEDIDGDGDLDVFVANDTVRNFLFANNGDGTFTESGVELGVAFDTAGAATGAMGVDIGDPGGDGHLAIAVGNFANETTSLYLAQAGVGYFADVANLEGIGSPSRMRLTFGLLFLDADLDGRLDLVQANGHLEPSISEVQASQSHEQPAQLFWNAGDAGRFRFVDLPADGIGDLARPTIGRALAAGDLDGDGDVDLVLTVNGGRPLVLRNDQRTGHHWLRVRLVGRPPNLEAIGASVVLRTVDGVQRRTVNPTRSYLAQVELPVTFGLGPADRVEAVEVRWPDGARSEVRDPGVDATLVIEHPGVATRE